MQYLYLDSEVWSGTRNLLWRASHPIAGKCYADVLRPQITCDYSIPYGQSVEDVEGVDKRVDYAIVSLYISCLALLPLHPAWPCMSTIRLPESANVRVYPLFLHVWHTLKSVMTMPSLRSSGVILSSRSGCKEANSFVIAVNCEHTSSVDYACSPYRLSPHLLDIVCQSGVFPQHLYFKLAAFRASRVWIVSV